MAAAAVFNAVGGRLVFTYEPQHWPAGILTGYVNDAGGFVLEHVIVFPGTPPDTLRAMLAAGLEEAWARDYPYVLFHVPDDFPPRRALIEVGRRLGFEEAAPSFWVRHRPAVERSDTNLITEQESA